MDAPTDFAIIFRLVKSLIEIDCHFRIFISLVNCQAIVFKHAFAALRLYFFKSFFPNMFRVFDLTIGLFLQWWNLFFFSFLFLVTAIAKVITSVTLIDIGYEFIGHILIQMAPTVNQTQQILVRDDFCSYSKRVCFWQRSMIAKTNYSWFIGMGRFSGFIQVEPVISVKDLPILYDAQYFHYPFGEGIEYENRRTNWCISR